METDNWVDAKFKRESMLRDGSGGVWQEAKTALHSSCESFKSRFGGKTVVECKSGNGHRYLVTITFHLEPDGQPMPDTVIRRVEAQYNDESHYIEVLVDKQTPKKFQIKSDTTHAYIDSGGREISADEFSQYALHDALFSPPVRHKKAML